MPKLLKPSLKSIVASSVPAAQAHPQASVARFPQQPEHERRTAEPRATLKERAKQLSVYLEPAVYDQLREIAYTERSKIHTLLLEGLDLVFRERGARSIEDLCGTQTNSGK